MTPLQDARNALRVAKERIAADDQLIAKAKAQVEPARKRKERIAKALQARKAVIARPGNHYLRTSLDCVGLPYFDNAAREALTGIPKDKVEERLGELLAAGTLKVNLNGEGTSLTVRGLASKTRLVDKAAIARMDRAKKAMDAADERAREARKAYNDLVAAEHAAGEPFTVPEAVAAWAPSIAARLALSAAESRTRGSLGSWEREALIRDATAHLEHVQSKSKAPCPCIPCTRDRESKQRHLLTVAHAKEQERAMRALPKVSFTCPTCKRDSIAPVVNGAVKCQQRGCSSHYAGGGAFPADVLRTKSVPKSTAVGPVLAAV